MSALALAPDERSASLNEVGASAGRALDPFAAFAAAFGECSPEAAMREACRQLREAAQEIEPPIGVERRMFAVLRARKGASIEGVGGRLELDHGMYVVGVGDEGSWRRRRFTVAHELGHMMILDALSQDPALIRAVASREHHAELEDLCNLAAAELLMPSEVFSQDVESLRFTTEDLLWLHSRYRVSWAALLTRLTEFVGGCSVALFSRAVRPGEGLATTRVVGCYGRRGVWMPTGLSTRYLSSKVVERAFDDGLASEADLTVSFGGRSSRARSLAAALPTSSDHYSGVVALLLLDPDDTQRWREMQAPAQLRLPMDV